jgi:predicted metal-dependent phosphoesterase TrpH
MAKFDHHVHTSRHSPDSILDPYELVERIHEIGLDGVVITEHDYQWQADEIAELSARADGVRVFSGVEVSAREGHFLVYGLPSLNETPPGITLRDLLKVARGHGAAVVAAHPFRWDQDFDAIIAEHGDDLHALEFVSNNVTPETRAKTERLLQRRPMGKTGSSDGHDVDTVGCYYTEFPGAIDTLAEFIAAIQKGTGRPRHRPGARHACGAVD